MKPKSIKQILEETAKEQAAYFIMLNKGVK